MKNNKKNYVWIIEGALTYSTLENWTPTLGFPGISGTYLTRNEARLAAEKMSKENKYNNKTYLSCKYRVRKYGEL